MRCYRHVALFDFHRQEEVRRYRVIERKERGDDVEGFVFHNHQQRFGVCSRLPHCVLAIHIEQWKHQKTLEIQGA